MSDKSFIMHLDSLSVLSEMNNEQAGVFIKTLYSYQLNKKLPDNLDLWLKLAIKPFVNQFNRDREKYKKSEISGIIGNLKKYHEPIYKEYIAGNINLEDAQCKAYPHKKELNKLKANPIAPDRPRSLNDNVNVSVNVNDNVNVSVNDNVSVNVNDNNIIPNNKTVGQKKRKHHFNDFQLQVAKQLGEFLKERKQLNLTLGTIKKWANDIRLLQNNELKLRKDSQQDIIKAIQSVLDNSDSKFFPVIESGSSFRKKFLKIESFQGGEKSNFINFIND